MCTSRDSDPYEWLSTAASRAFEIRNGDEGWRTADSRQLVCRDLTVTTLFWLFGEGRVPLCLHTGARSTIISDEPST
jgi:hypothetical protein